MHITRAPHTPTKDVLIPYACLESARMDKESQTFFKNGSPYSRPSSLHRTMN